MSGEIFRRRRSLAALVLLSAAAGAIAAPAPEPAAGLDGAEAIVSAVEREAAKLASPDFCFPEPFAEDLAERLKADAADIVPLMSSNTAVGDLLMAHVCRALAAGSPDGCDALRGIPIVPIFSQMPSKSATHTLERRCRANYMNVLMSKAAVDGDGSLERLCLENEAVHPVFRTGRAAEGCRLFGASRSDSSVCARLSPLLDAGATGCVESSRQLAGDAAFCPQIPDAMNRELCLGAAAYRDARSRGPRACGDSSVCRMMAAPGGDECRSYDRRLRRVLCPALGLIERTRGALELIRRLDEADGLIASAGGTPERGAAARADSLAERAARARGGLETLRELPKAGGALP